VKDVICSLRGLDVKKGYELMFYEECDKTDKEEELIDVSRRPK
jgi:hypothetical protein